MNTKFFELEKRDGDNELVNVAILAKNEMPIIEIGSQNSMDIADSQSALRAASDFYRFELYNHPLTGPNLHLYAKTGDIKSLFRATNIGVVSTTYDGDLPIPVPHESEYPQGWAQLNLRNGRFYLSHFNAEYSDLRSRKHDFVEALVRGYGMKLRVLPFNKNKGEDGLGLADKIVATWMEEDDDKAYEMRIEGYNRAQARSYMNRGVVKAIRENHGMPAAETPVVSKGQPVNGGIIVTTVQGELVDVTKLPFCNMVVYDARKGKFHVTWDGSFASKARLKAVADAQGWTVEIPNRL